MLVIRLEFTVIKVLYSSVYPGIMPGLLWEFCFIMAYTFIPIVMVLSGYQKPIIYQGISSIV